MTPLLASRRLASDTREMKPIFDVLREGSGSGGLARVASALCSVARIMKKKKEKESKLR